MGLLSGLLSCGSLYFFQSQMGHGRFAKCVAYRFKNSARSELLLQKVTLATSASTAKFGCMLEKPPKDDFHLSTGDSVLVYWHTVVTWRPVITRSLPHPGAGYRKAPPGFLPEKNFPP